MPISLKEDKMWNMLEMLKADFQQVGDFFFPEMSAGSESYILYNLTQTYITRG